MNNTESKMSKKSNTARVLKVQPVETAPQVEVPAVQPVAVKIDDKGRKTEVIMSMEDLGNKGIKNKSQAIRFLIGDGYSPSAVAKFLNIRYQHVRNVSMQILKRPTAPVVLGEAPAIVTMVDLRAVESATDL